PLPDYSRERDAPTTFFTLQNLWDKPLGLAAKSHDYKGRQQATVSSLICSILFSRKNEQCKIFKPHTPISLHFLRIKQPLCIDKAMFYSSSADPTYTSNHIWIKIICTYR
ncbi:MAG: hypothetical protein QNJ51_10485, partial [Calothrix sp. MO_167.B12]|nr:hypothetical protein [Calothrix sp. MO_167.B12]